MSDQGFTSQKLNLTLALCAILISIASFYATYLQANAAEKQVKAMTLPLLEYASGNVDRDTKKSVLSFSVINNGVGPAILKSSTYRYKDQEYQYFSQFLKACCQVEYSQFKENKPLNYLKLGSEITSSMKSRILPVQKELKFYQLYNGELSASLWKKLNNERFHMTMELCYCSLLGECYITQHNKGVNAVDVCPVQK